MQDPLAITPLPGPFHVTLDDLPGSKSLTNRALLIAALAEGTSRLSNVLFSEDTRVMMDALDRLGFELQRDEKAGTVTVHGRGGEIPADEAELFLGNAGTAMRFLTAACCLGHGTYLLRGGAPDDSPGSEPRMHQRPIGQLVDALRQLSAEIEYVGEEGYPPLRVRGAGLRGGEVTLKRTVSSQYISALLLAGPLMDSGLALRFDGPVTSWPYVAMTAATMERFGLVEGRDVVWLADHRRADRVSSMWVHPASYAGRDGPIEPDASNASYFLSAAAGTPEAECRVAGLGRRSVQGDAHFADLLGQMGADVAFRRESIAVTGPEALDALDVELNAMPDMAQTLAVVALFATGETIIRDVGNLRVKETDRLAALQSELTKLGATVTVEADDLWIAPPADNVLRHPDGTPIDEQHPVEIETYDDHRMAMSFAVAGLRQAGVRIRDPGCVDKTFPDFWNWLDRLHEAAASATSARADG